MKKIIIFMGLFLMVSTGCEKDEMLIESANDVTTDIIGTTSKAKKTKFVPLKGHTIEIADINAPPILCLGAPFPSRFLDIGGQITHLGNVEGGYIEFSNCRLEFIDEDPFLFADAIGEFLAANGDTLSYEGAIWTSPTDPAQISAYMNITGGTGRWENAMGNFTGLAQPYEDSKTLFTISGKVTPPGKNK